MPNRIKAHVTVEVDDEHADAMLTDLARHIARYNNQIRHVSINTARVVAEVSPCACCAGFTTNGPNTTCDGCRSDGRRYGWD